MMKLRFTRPWRNYRTGQVAEIPGGVAAELVAKGAAVRDHQLEIETAALEPVAETADATPKRRGRRAAVSESQQTDQPRR